MKTKGYICTLANHYVNIDYFQSRRSTAANKVIELMRADLYYQSELYFSQPRWRLLASHSVNINLFIYFFNVSWHLTLPPSYVKCKRNHELELITNNMSCLHSSHSYFGGLINMESFTHRIKHKRSLALGEAVRVQMQYNLL